MTLLLATVNILHMELRLDELAERAGVSPRTVRYYIAQGLLPSPGRLGPMTRYGREHLERLRLVKRLQEERLSLAEIRSRLEDQPVHGNGDARSAQPTAERVGMLTRDLPRRSSRPEAWDRFLVAPDVELHVRRSRGTPADAWIARAIDAVSEIVGRRSESG